METGHLKPLALVEAMSVYALRSRVQVKLTGTSDTPERGEPREQGSSIATGTALREGDEVVHVQVATPREVLTQAEAGHGYWLAVISERSELITGELL